MWFLFIWEICSLGMLLLSYSFQWNKHIHNSVLCPLTLPEIMQVLGMIYALSDLTLSQSHDYISSFCLSFAGRKAFALRSLNQFNCKWKLSYPSLLNIKKPKKTKQKKNTKKQLKAPNSLIFWSYTSCSDSRKPHTYSEILEVTT